MMQLPNILTIGRVFCVPLVIFLLYLDSTSSDWLACFVFILACITDYFDGYLARKRQQLSEFGKFLDPIADKLLVVSLLFMLVSKDYIYDITIIPAIIIVCREILISGLREYLAGANIDMPVSKMAKWKTAIQMLSLGLLIIGPSSNSFIFFMGQLMLWLSSVLTLITGYAYLQAGYTKMRQKK